MAKLGLDSICIHIYAMNTLKNKQIFRICDFATHLH